jgi:prolyl-tRNA editing enzyme YbaK/EbsC (Cys-tRNA(Pro) deacylase)
VKTNAARLLDSLGIGYQLREYQIDEEDLSAVAVGRKIGLPPEQVFKTLVCPAYADESVELFDVISVSAGARGTQILLAPADYLRATGAKAGPLTR